MRRTPKKPDRNRAHKRIRAKARAMALRRCVEWLRALDATPFLPRRLPESDEAERAFLGGIREARGLLERRARQYGRIARKNGRAR